MPKPKSKKTTSHAFTKSLVSKKSSRSVNVKPIVTPSLQNPWKTRSINKAYENPWIKVSEAKVITPGGSPGIYGVVHFKNLAVGIVAIDADDRILMVGQFRYPLDEYSWEIPEGGCPLGSDPLATAKRELKEETGFTAKRWRRLLSLTLSNSSTDERAQIFEAFDLKGGEAEPEDTEQLMVRWLPFQTVLDQVNRGEIQDAITVAAVLRVALNRKPSRSRKTPATTSQT